MPYQQVVQPPKKPAGRGVAADAPTDKTAPVGDVPDCRRPSTRGWGGGSQSISHPRGIPGKASAQPPCQEGDLPSGSRPSVPPPPPAPERTQPQRGGQPRSALRDPMRLAANVHSSGWRKTWSISSRSTTGSALPPLGRQNGRGLRSSSLTTSSGIRGKPWPSRRPIQWTLWPTSRTSSIRPPASTWIAWRASQAGSRRGTIIMG